MDRGGGTKGPSSPTQQRERERERERTEERKGKGKMRERERNYQGRKIEVGKEDILIE